MAGPGAGPREKVARALLALVLFAAVSVAADAAGTIPRPAPGEAPESPGVAIGAFTNFGDATFSFTSDIPGAANFDVTTENNEGLEYFPAPAGTYTVTQQGPPAPFVFKSVWGEGCTLVGSQTFEVVVTADDTTTCFAENNQTAVRVTKTAIGQDGTFSFTSDIPGLANFDVTTIDGQGEYAASVPPGTYTITEVGPPAPFVFERVDGCDPGGPPQSVTVTLGEGELGECEFVNRSPGDNIKGPFVTGPIPAQTSVAVSSLPIDGSTSGLGQPLPNGQIPTGAPSPGVTFEGLGTETGSFSAPLDPNGDVGPNHYVQGVNTVFAVFDKTGTLLSGPHTLSRLWTGQGGECEANNTGDPIVLYDQLADRWLISQIYSPNEGLAPPYGICVAISRTPDPLGSYHLYDIPSLRFTDYPKFGVWDDGYYLGTNPEGFTKADVWAFEKQAMLDGAPLSPIRFSANPTNFFLPADLDGPTPPPAGTPNWFTTFESPDSPGGGPPRLRVVGFDADFDQPANSTFADVADIPIAAFEPTCVLGAAACVTQPAPGGTLDPLAGLPMYRGAYRNFGDQQSIVGNFTHGVGPTDDQVAATRWWELRNTAGAWSLHQEGDLGGGSTNRWVGSTAQDRNGGLAVGYSLSDTTTFPSIVYSARSPLLPLGTLGPAATMVEGGGSQMGQNRWGDYTALTVDPADDCTFWYTNTYYAETGVENHTAIGAFRRPDCAPVALALTKTAEVTEASSGQTIDYRLEYSNSQGEVTEVVLTETVPVGTVFAGPEGWDGCSPGAAAGTVCTRVLPDLGPGEGGETTFTVVVDDPASVSTIENQAVLSAGYGAEPVSASATTPVVTNAPPPTAGTPTQARNAPVLPATGGHTGATAALAIGLLVVGGALVAAAHRKARGSGSLTG